MMKNLPQPSKMLAACMMLIFFLVISCKKNASEKPKEIEKEEPTIASPVTPVSGTVSLPAGSALDIKRLTAVSPVDKLSLSDAKYTLKRAANFSTELVTSSEDEIMLMGYSYPEENNHVIDVNSTALAMAMNLPFSMSLNEAGKILVIDKIKSSVKFKDLVNEVTKSVINGKSVTDETNEPLIRALADLIIEVESNLGAKISMAKNGNTRDIPIGTAKLMTTPGLERRSNAAVPANNSYLKAVPVKISSAFSVMSLENNRLSSTFAVGIYVGDKREKFFMVPGVKLFATSLKEMYAGVFEGGYNESFQELVTLQPDKNYEVRIRSGKPGVYDSSPEFKAAMLENAKQVVGDLLSNYMPNLSDLDKSCVGSYKAGVTDLVYETLETLKDANQSNIASTIVAIAGKSLSTSVEILENCGIERVFFKAIKKFFDISAHVSKIAVNMNTTIQVYHWLNVRPSIDTCFTIINNKIVKCRPEPAKVALISGNGQMTEFNTKLTDPLKVKVTDVNEAAIEGVYVDWIVKSGGGTLSSATSLTDVNGIAQIEWTTGSSGSQSVEVSVKKRNGELVPGSPLVFKTSAMASLVGSWAAYEVIHNSRNVYNNTAYHESFRDPRCSIAGKTRWNTTSLVFDFNVDNNFKATENGIQSDMDLDTETCSLMPEEHIVHDDDVSSTFSYDATNKTFRLIKSGQYIIFKITSLTETDLSIQFSEASAKTDGVFNHVEFFDREGSAKFKRK